MNPPVKKILVYIALLCLVVVANNASAQEVDSLKKRLNALPEKEKVDALNQLAAYTFSDSPDQSDKYAFEAETLARRLGYAPGESNALINQGRVDDMLFNSQEAYRHFYKAIKISQNSGDSYTLGRAYYNLAGLNLNDRQYSNALINYNKALEIGRMTNDKKTIYHCLSGLGELYNFIGDPARSIDYLQRALNLQMEIGQKVSISWCYSNIGDVYYDTKNYDKALYYYKKSYDLALEYGSLWGLSLKADQLSLAYDQLKNYEKAIYYQEQSLELSKELNRGIGMLTSYSHLASFYTDMKDLKRAKMYLDTSSALCNKLQDKELAARVNEYYGDYYRALNDINKAIQYYELALEYYRNENFRHELERTSKSMYECYNIAGDYKNQLKYYKIYTEAKDSISAEENKKLFDAVQAKVEAERAVEALKKENAEQIARNDSLRSFIIAGIVLLVLAGATLQSRYRMQRDLRSKEDEITKIAGMQEWTYSVLVNDIKNSLFSLADNITRTNDSDVHEELVSSYENFLGKLNGLIKHLGRAGKKDKK